MFLALLFHPLIKHFVICFSYTWHSLHITNDDLQYHLYRNFVTKVAEFV